MAKGSKISDFIFQLEKVKVNADQHSLFRAVAKSIEGNEFCYQKYRDVAAEYIEKHGLLNDFNDVAKKQQYLEGLRSTEWGGQLEIKALAGSLGRQIMVFHERASENGEQSFLVNKYPESEGGDADDSVEERISVIYLLFRELENSVGENAGYYELLVKKAKAEMNLATLTSELNTQVEMLKKEHNNVSKKFHTSLRMKNLMDVKNLGCAEVLPILDGVAAITQKNSWYFEEETRKAIYNAYCVLSNTVEVTGDPARNIFFISPVVFVVHVVAIIIYYPIMVVLMVLMMLGRIQGWVTLITGFAGATISAISLKSADPNETGTAGQILGIVTGILAAAKGVNLDEDHLYQRVEDLTIDIIRRAFGNIIPKEAVFQSLYDFRKHEKFCMTIEITKADTEMVQRVRIFYALALDTSLVQNEDNLSEIHKMHMKSKLIEGALIDPYNYLTFEKLRTENLEDIYGFKPEDAEQILKYFKTIISVRAFCDFLKKLNEEPILPFPIASSANADRKNSADAATAVGVVDRHVNASNANLSQNDAEASNVTERSPLLSSSGIVLKSV